MGMEVNLMFYEKLMRERGYSGTMKWLALKENPVRKETEKAYLLEWNVHHWKENNECETWSELIWVPKSCVKTW